MVPDSPLGAPCSYREPSRRRRSAVPLSHSRHSIRLAAPVARAACGKLADKLLPQRTAWRHEMATTEDFNWLFRTLAKTHGLSQQEFARIALRYANDVLTAPADGLEAPPAQGEAAPPSSTSTPASSDAARPKPRPSVPVPAYDGPLRICLDFGTAMSKAFAWDGERDEPLPLRIGDAAGETSPYAVNSTIFISRDGQAWFGEAAEERAAADPDAEPAFRSIKDLLTVGLMTDLREPLESQFNPSGVELSKREAVVLYLAFLTDCALAAMCQDHGESSRDIPLTYTKPVFDPERDRWARDTLRECAAVARGVAEKLSGRWSAAIPLAELKDALSTAEPRDLMLGDETLPEPAAAFAGRVWRAPVDVDDRRLMMVVDVGAGTTDFAMFARLQREGKVALFPIAHSMTTIRLAGNDVDNFLLDYLLQSANVTTNDGRFETIRAHLRLEIRLIKEELFDNGTVSRPLVNDIWAEAELTQFLEYDGMVRLCDEMQRKFEEVLANVDKSWREFKEVDVIFTGGGARLPLVTRLARSQPTPVDGWLVTPRAVHEPPKWLVESYGNLAESYASLAVCIGGACRGSGDTPLDLNQELERFGGDLARAEWKMPDAPPYRT